MIKKLALLACLLIGITPKLSKSDVVIMSSGHEIDCVIIQENSDTIVIRRGYGTMSISREEISSLTKTPVITEAPPTATQITARRLPPWSVIVGKLVSKPWANNLRQIPATVIDKGALMSVPYQSYRCGADYKVNIYGDPDAPAGIEIGVYRSLLHDATAKQNCVDLISEVLGDPVDSAIVKVLDRNQDLVVRGGVTTEISPETEPDSYGGWWVSVYNTADLEKAKATPEELNQITVASPPMASNPLAGAGGAVPRGSLATSMPTVAVNPEQPIWTPSDWASVRPSSSAGGEFMYVAITAATEPTSIPTRERHRGLGAADGSRSGLINLASVPASAATQRPLRTRRPKPSYRGLPLL